MTVEERAKKVMETWRNSWHLGTSLTEEVWRGWIEDALRDQIEECARLVDQAHLMSFSQLAKCIRDMKGPTNDR